MDNLRIVAKFQYHPVGVEVDSLPATYLASALRGVLRDNARHYYPEYESRILLAKP
jgi:hypothetical protein